MYFIFLTELISDMNNLHLKIFIYQIYGNNNLFKKLRSTYDIYLFLLTHKPIKNRVFPVSGFNELDVNILKIFLQMSFLSTMLLVINLAVTLLA
jgi:hypothetical protein